MPGPALRPPWSTPLLSRRIPSQRSSVTCAWCSCWEPGGSPGPASLPEDPKAPAFRQTSGPTCFPKPQCCAVPSRFSPVQLCVTPWTAARQAPLSMGFSRQEYWSGLPCPAPGDLPDPGIKLTSLMSSAGSLPLAPPGKPPKPQGFGQN